MHSLLGLILLVWSSASFAGPTFWRGTLGGKTKVTMKLDQSAGNAVSGVYFYDKVGVDILLRGQKEKDGSLAVKEYSDLEALAAGKSTGSFRLYILNEQMKGEWSNAAGTKRLAVDMTEQMALSNAGFESLRPAGSRRSAKTSPEPKASFKSLFVNFQRDKTKILPLIFPKEVASSKASDVDHKDGSGDCRAMYAADAFAEDALDWSMNKSVLKVWTDYPQAFRACNISATIDSKVLGSYIRRDGPLGKFAQPLPKEVVAWKVRQEDCTHWAGEEPYSKERAAEISAAVARLNCANLESEAASIRKKYGATSPEADAVKTE